MSLSPQLLQASVLTLAFLVSRMRSPRRASWFAARSTAGLSLPAARPSHTSWYVLLGEQARGTHLHHRTRHHHQRQRRQHPIQKSHDFDCMGPVSASETLLPCIPPPCLRARSQESLKRPSKRPKNAPRRPRRSPQHAQDGPKTVRHDRADHAFPPPHPHLPPPSSCPRQVSPSQQAWTLGGQAGGALKGHRRGILI